MCFAIFLYLHNLKLMMVLNHFLYHGMPILNASLRCSSYSSCMNVYLIRNERTKNAAKDSGLCFTSYTHAFYEGSVLSVYQEEQGEKRYYGWPALPFVSCTAQLLHKGIRVSSKGCARFLSYRGIVLFCVQRFASQEEV